MYQFVDFVDRAGKACRTRRTKRALRTGHRQLIATLRGVQHQAAQYKGCFRIARRKTACQFKQPRKTGFELRVRRRQRAALGGAG